MYTVCVSALLTPRGQHSWPRRQPAAATDGRSVGFSSQHTQAAAALEQLGSGQFSSARWCTHCCLCLNTNIHQFGQVKSAAGSSCKHVRACTHAVNKRTRNAAVCLQNDVSNSMYLIRFTCRAECFNRDYNLAIIGECRWIPGKSKGIPKSNNAVFQMNRCSYTPDARVCPCAGAANW